jgi:3D (Asp-Asp-Asp) domain-containing protein
MSRAAFPLTLERHANRERCVKRGHETMKRSSPIWPVVLICVLSASASADPVEHSLVVTATAYNSLAEQTDDEPHLAAWGDPLVPGMKAIAVSRDLIPVGLSRHTPVTIEGFPGVYLVLDKMHKRWEKRIDIYMGLDLEAARAWGKRQVEISW